MKSKLAALFLAVALLLAGCNLPVLDAPPITAHPQVTAAPGYVEAPAPTEYEGWSLRVKPANGPQALLTDGLAAQLILAAEQDKSLRASDATGRFGNRVEVLDPQGTVQRTYSLNSEGQLLLKDKDGRAFRIPEYVYYLIEQQLWAYAGSLKDSLMVWQPSAGTEAMETDLDRLIKTAELPAWGYADAYFQTYEVLGEDTSARDQVRVYIMLSYAGYTIKDGQFDQSFQCTAPARLVFSRVQGNRWQLTDFRQADPNVKGRQALYDNLRKVLPYDYMEDVMKEMGDTSALAQEIHRQAADYLRARGLSDLTIGD